jgi:hypothetical protein
MIISQGEENIMSAAPTSDTRSRKQRRGPGQSAPAPQATPVLVTADQMAAMNGFKETLEKVAQYAGYAADDAQRGNALSAGQWLRAGAIELVKLNGTMQVLSETLTEAARPQ